MFEALAKLQADGMVGIECQNRTEWVEKEGGHSKMLGQPKLELGWKRTAPKKFLVALEQREEERGALTMTTREGPEIKAGWGLARTGTNQQAEDAVMPGELLHLGGTPG